MGGVAKSKQGQEPRPRAAPAPTAPSKSARTRGPNAVRREATRQKLLDATIECLYRYGYFGTSTVLVTEVAGVSRGSLLHQFPTKTDLMIATAEYIAKQRGEHHRARLAEIQDDREKFRALPQVTWEELSKPSGIARIELMLAARSDPEFAERMTPLNERLEQASKDAVWGLVQRLGVKDRPRIDTLVQLYIAAVRGFAIDGLYDHSRAHVPDMVKMLQQYQDWMLEEILRTQD